MKANYTSAYLFFIIFFLASCVGSRKIDFDNAYKFSTYKYQKSMDDKKSNPKETPSANELSVSTDVKTDINPEIRLAEIERHIYDKMGIAREEADVMEISDLKSKFDQLDRKHKREIKKEIKAELKSLERNNAYSAHDTDQINELNNYMYWSIIIGSVGLVFLLLGALFSVSFLSIVGALAIVGAAVLFILDQV